ncbi:hypothetical protein CFBP498_40990 [Xanthomonas hortorum pv. vitians]|uniref:Uncharacterized protein n=1 Tax=Xanthomonas hortorum pv. vitians TaxID=83224 RepID=A0A6V7EZ83_9XANT|nr:hypothetical protein CFBP498_40990 [Xanthomonas hortorum pv. vitians]CAD0356521.1 hypothetical protein CFBP498_40990 [Xanthomonas hortorum pv. vitians]
MDAGGALRTGVYEWYMPVTSTDRIRLAMSAAVLLSALSVTNHRPQCHCGQSKNNA